MSTRPGESNGHWSEIDEDPMQAQWDGFDALPIEGQNDALDALAREKHITLGGIVWAGGRMKDPLTLAFAGPKRLKFRQIETGKRWSASNSDMSRLKLLRAGTKPTAELLVVESETDAAWWHGRGVDVAIHPNGAGNVTGEMIAAAAAYDRPLIALDADEAGDDGSTKWLTAIPHAVRYAPPGVKDWCELPPDAELAPFPEPSVSSDSPRYANRRVDLATELTKPPQAIPWRVVGIGADGTSTTIVAQGGVGKTWVLYGLADGVVRGRDVAGLQCIKGNAVIFDGEMGRAMAVDRIRAGGYSPDIALYDVVGLDLSKPDDQAWFEAIVSEHINPDAGGFVGVDSLRRLTPSKRENESDDMAPVLTFLASLARKTNAFVLTIHHAGHDASHGRGSSAIGDQSDALFLLTRPKGSDDSDGMLRKLSARGTGTKAPRYARPPEDVFLRIADDGGIVAADAPPETAKVDEYEQAIREALPAQTKRSIAEACGTTDGNNTWQRAWKRLVDHEAITKTDGVWTVALTTAVSIEPSI